MKWIILLIIFSLLTFEQVLLQKTDDHQRTPTSESFDIKELSKNDAIRPLLVDIIEATDPAVNKTNHPARIKEALTRYLIDLGTIHKRETILQALSDANLTLPKHLSGSPELIGVFSEFLNYIQKNYDDLLKNTTTDAFIDILMTNVSTQKLLNLSDKVNTTLNEYKISENSGSKMLLDPNQGIDTSKMAKKYKNIVENIIPNYLDNLPLKNKRKIIMNILKLPSNADPKHQLARVLASCGPGMQKMFQLMAKDVQSPEIKSVVEALQHEVPFFEQYEVEKILRDNFGDDFHHYFDDFSYTPLAAGTVGQVHKAHLRGDPDDKFVIVKLLRPNIREDMNEEFEMIYEIADDSDKKIIEDLKSSIMKELDLRKERQFINKGTQYEDASNGIRVAKVIKRIQTSQDVLVTEIAQGKTLNSFPHGQFLTQRTKRIRHFAGQWFERALFGDGYFHGDLHPGNLFFNPDANYESKSTLTIIDFGNTGKLTKIEQGTILSIMKSVAANDPDGIIRSYDPIFKIPKDLQDQYRHYLVTMLKENVPVDKKVNRALSKAVELEFALSAAFLQFSRGKLFIDNIQMGMNAEIKVHNLMVGIFNGVIDQDIDMISKSLIEYGVVSKMSSSRLTKIQNILRQQQRIEIKVMKILQNFQSLDNNLPLRTWVNKTMLDFMNSTQSIPKTLKEVIPYKLYQRKVVKNIAPFIGANLRTRFHSCTGLLGLFIRAL